LHATFYTIKLYYSNFKKSSLIETNFEQTGLARRKKVCRSAEPSVTQGAAEEIGAARAIAAAEAKLLEGSPTQIEYAAERGLEYNIELTCDPVLGQGRIPCIERNGHAATRALNCSRFSLFTDGRHKLPFDEIVAVIEETEQALPPLYQKTSMAGIARAYLQRLDG